MSAGRKGASHAIPAAIMAALVLMVVAYNLRWWTLVPAALLAGQAFRLWRRGES